MSGQDVETFAAGAKQKKKTTWWDRIFSVITWAVIAAIPIGIVKYLWDKELITTKMLADVGNSTFVIGWGLVFLALVVFMWKNERINRTISEAQEKSAAQDRKLKYQEQTIRDLQEHLSMKEELYQQKVQQLYDDIEHQVQRRLVLAQQASHQQVTEKNRLVEMRSRRLEEMNQNLPLLKELKSLRNQLQNLQAQVVTDAGVRLLKPEELMDAVVGLCTRAESRLLLVSRTLQREPIAALDRSLTGFWEKGGQLVLWLDRRREALAETVDLAALLEWWELRTRQLECWGFSEPLPRMLVADGKEALLLNGDLLGTEEGAWTDLATQVLAPGLAVELDAMLQERMVSNECDPWRLSVHQGDWQAYTDRHDHGILMVSGLDREIYIALENYRLLNDDFCKRTVADRVRLLLCGNRFGRYDYLAHNFISGTPGPAAAPAEQPESPLPF